MENIFDILERDHERITELLSEVSVETDEDQLDDLFNQLLEEMDDHMEREEEHLYPSMERNEATMALVQEAYEEHDRARQLADELAELSYTNSRWTGLFTELKEAMGHHIGFEEHQVFPKLQRLYSPEQLNEFARKMQQ